MTQIVRGSLTIVGANTEDLSVFWKGKLIPNLRDVRMDWDKEEQLVQLRVTSINEVLEVELEAAGITVKKGRRHV